VGVSIVFEPGARIGSGEAKLLKGTRAMRSHKCHFWKPLRRARRRWPVRSSGGIVTQARQSQFPSDGNHCISQDGGTLEKAVAMANHASTCTTQLYDRRREEFSLDEGRANRDLEGRHAANCNPPWN